MPFDPEQHERGQREFLCTLREMEGEFIGSLPEERVFIGFRSPFQDVRTRAGLERRLAERIALELDEYSLIERIYPLDGGGTVELTIEGRKYIDNLIYEKTGLAKRRK